MEPYIIYLSISIVILASIAFSSFRKLKVRGAKSIFALSLTILLCYLFNMMGVLFPSHLIEEIRTAFNLFGLSAAATLVFTFSIEYTFRSRRTNRYVLLLLALISIITQVFFWFPETVLFFQHLTSIQGVFGVFSLPEHINLLYRYTLIATSVWMLANILFSSTSFFNSKLLILIIGPLLSFISLGLVLLEFHTTLIKEIYSVSIIFCVVGFFHSSFYLSSNAGLLMKLENVIQSVDDGWLVINMQNSIMDYNQATAKLTGHPLVKLYNQSISTVFPDFLDLTKTMDNNQELEMDKTFQVDDEYRYLNIRVATLQDEENIAIGRLVTWRDITNRKRTEAARQQARDEMFVLLNAISSTASQATTLQEFLSDAIYQIIYPFRSQIVLIYIYDERENMGNAKEYYLAAQLGLDTDSAKELSKLPISSSLFEWNDQNRQYLLLDNLQDQYIPRAIKTLEMSCLLVIHLTVQVGTEKRLIGSLIMGRKDNSVFKQDEIIRLTILADQIATLIDSDRRRKLAISLAERQRLMRDIHDSVSQKLYGLVAVTEAALAGIEAEVEVDYGQVLSRISDNARQAVKELRLFLFQMLPIDLEKDGLVSVLHHRLAAVEGRADIKVRFLADEPIALSKRKEVALYYIAQEALNNILRHAHAKSVAVTLKQGYKYVTFEIADDGCGFENDKLEKGGLGLQNIKERVKQESGKLKISSQPNKGTIIKVTFEKDILDTLSIIE